PLETWYPYLNLITHPPDPILIHLRIEEQAEIEAWIRGTEIERLIAQNRILSLSQLRAIYEGLAPLSKLGGICERLYDSLKSGIPDR
ncbi:hypothetical protein Pst134EA_031816, partial [Puccinia striiformis f. sp. tritici]|uniref:uncharacterized protein n=1 Tax=Puccinia striiformis f. sp. tritici TaxID=168172 RepID=UPI002007C89C